MDLKNIKSPQDIKHCSVDELYHLASQIRETIIGQVAKHGGHLASSLGVVELTLALHYVFNAPDDKIVWDVGHQAYVHKLLTGRFDRFDTLRQQGDLGVADATLLPPNDEIWYTTTDGKVYTTNCTTSSPSLVNRFRISPVCHRCDSFHEAAINRSFNNVCKRIWNFKYTRSVIHGLQIPATILPKMQTTIPAAYVHKSPAEAPVATSIARFEQ